MTPEIVFEDNHLLALSKPAGMLVQGDSTGDASLVDWAREYRIHHEQKTGNAFIGLVHRIDRPVSGMVVLAKTTKAASRLSEQFRDRLVRKLYLAVCESAGRSNRVAVGEELVWATPLSRPGPSDDPSEGMLQDARTRATLRATVGRNFLFSFEPETGRKHQLRQHAAEHGYPIVGDSRYGASQRFSSGIALHALALQFLHPVKKEPVIVSIPPPASWRIFPFDPTLFAVGNAFKHDRA